MSERALELLRGGDVENFNAWRLEHADAPLELRGADLSELDLSGAWLMGAQLDGASFAHGTLHNAVFTGASLEDADFTNADLTGAIFGPPELIAAAMAASPLGEHLYGGTTCARATFHHATLTNASFRETRLCGADFTGANHADADMTRAALDDAILPEHAATLEDKVWGALPGLSPDQKRDYILSLYTIACVDGDFDESEQALLSMIAQRMELTQEEFDACLPTAAFSLDDVRITPPDDDEVRVQWLRNLIMMVAADGVLQATEYQTCLFFASQLGFEPNIVDDVLMSMAQ